MIKWKQYALEDVCTRISSGKGIPSSSIHPEGPYAVYGGNGVRGYTDTANFSGDCAIVGRQGAYCGNVRYFIGEAYMTEHAIVVCANKNHNTRYLTYLLSTMNLGRLSAQSAQPGLSVKTLSKQIVKMPPLEIQNKIATLLGSIDNKVEENQRINDNLQQQARALFKAWFVDFEPFGGEMPSEWHIGKLKDILRLKRDGIKVGDEPNLPYLPIDVIPMKTFAVSEFKPNEDAQSSLITFDKDDIVIGAMRVYFHRVIIAPCRGITRTTCFTLKPYDAEYLSFGLLCCDQDSSIDYAQTTSKGSTMPYAVWDGGLGDMEIAIPPKDVAKKFNDTVLPMLHHIQDSYFENRNLVEMRDSLLPRLMSGEIDVSDVEI